MAFNQSPVNPLTAIHNGQAYLDDLANQNKYLIKPKSVTGIGGFLFDYEGETNLQLQSDITDHFIENNTAIQDHVARKPIRITLRGFVAELVYLRPRGVLGTLQELQNKLTTVPAYLGAYTPQQLQKIQAAITKTQNTINTINQALARVNNIVGFFDKAAVGPTKQVRAYRKFRSMWANHTIIVVETPYNTLTNMVIENVTFIQSAESKSWSDIVVTLKQLSFTESVVNPISKNANRYTQSSQINIQKGTTPGTPVAIEDFKERFA